MIPISVIGRGAESIQLHHDRSDAKPTWAIPPRSISISTAPLSGFARIASFVNAVLEVLAEALRLARAARARGPFAD
jgi:hypothetical protein